MFYKKTNMHMDIFSERWQEQRIKGRLPILLMPCRILTLIYKVRQQGYWEAQVMNGLLCP